MKKNELNNLKIRLSRETLRTLDEPELAPVAGNQPVTTATIRTCCVPNTQIC